MFIYTFYNMFYISTSGAPSGLGVYVQTLLTQPEKELRLQMISPHPLPRRGDGDVGLE